MYLLIKGIFCVTFGLFIRLKFGLCVGVGGHKHRLRVKKNSGYSGKQERLIQLQDQTASLHLLSPFLALKDDLSGLLNSVSTTLMWRADSS